MGKTRQTNERWAYISGGKKRDRDKRPISQKKSDNKKTWEDINNLKNKFFRNKQRRKFIAKGRKQMRALLQILIHTSSPIPGRCPARHCVNRTVPGGNRQTVEDSQGLRALPEVHCQSYRLQFPRWHNNLFLSRPPSPRLLFVPIALILNLCLIPCFYSSGGVPDRLTAN